LVGLFFLAFSRAGAAGLSGSNGEAYVWTASVVRPLYSPPIKTRIEYERIIEYSNVLNVFLEKLIEKNDGLPTVRVYVSPQSQDVIDLLVVSRWPLHEREKDDLQKLKVFAQDRFEKLLGVEK